MRHVYNNKYGRLEIEVAGLYQSVSSIHCRDLDSGLSFGIDDAEKIALITGNDGVQLCFSIDNHSKVFLIHHKSSNIAAPCRVISIDFDTKTKGL